MYIPGFTNMLMRPDLLQGGPAYADMTPRAMPEQVSMLPFAPEAPAPMMPSGAAPQQPNYLEAAKAAGLSDAFIADPYASIMSELDAMRVASYSPEEQAYIASVNDYIRGQNPTLGSFSSRLPTDNPEIMRSLMGNAPEQNAVYQFGPSSLDPKRRSGSFGGALNASYNSPVLLVDEDTGEVLVRGVGFGAAQEAANVAKRLYGEKGDKANFSIYSTPAGDADPANLRRVAHSTPQEGFFEGLGDALKVVAPAMLAAAFPGALALGLKGTAGSMLSAGLTAGLARSGAGLVAGDPLGEALKAGAITGGLAAAGAGIGGKLGALNKTAPVSDAVTAKLAKTVGSQLVPSAVGGFGPEIVVPGFKGALAGSTIGGTLGGAANAFSNMAPGKGADYADLVFREPTTPAVQTSPLDTVSDGPINVFANRAPTGGALPFASAGAGIMAQAGVDAARAAMERQAEPEREGEPITVTGSSIKPPSAFDAAFSGVAAPLAATPAAVASAVAPADVQGDPIEVAREKARKGEQLTGPDLDLLIGSGAGASAAGLLERGEVPPEQKKKPITVEDIQKYLKAAGLLSALLPGGGGGGRGALGRIPAGFGSGFGSGFGGSLPRATLPGASTGFAQRALAPQDYYRYGYGPSQSFFDYVPQGAPNTSQAFTGYEQVQAREGQGFYLGGMAGGGYMDDMSDNSFAVNGPGTGRSDEIPAMLSDGEYVMDAEFVALLGDGSPKAGADILDQFRINVRKDKGRDLVKGDFSANAKRPEHYLKGGRT